MILPWAITLVVCPRLPAALSAVDALVRFAQRGGRLIITGESGAYDPCYRQRRDNPLLKGLAGRHGVICRAEIDAAPIRGSGWTIKVASPGAGGGRLMADLAALWSPAIRIQAPATVFIEVKHTANAFYVHLVNYAPEPVAQGVRIELLAKGLDPGGCTFAVPMEDRLAAPMSLDAAGRDRRAVDLPSFAEYGVVRVKTQAASK